MDMLPKTKHRPSTDQVPIKYKPIPIEIRNLVKVAAGEKSRKELQQALELKHKGNFRENYIDPAIESGFIELKYPDSPNHPKQRYLLTEKGQELLINL